jgi:Tat protein translocase TatB subunit
MTFAILFSDVGAGEWFVLLAVILVVMGPKRLPETARKFGHYYSKFRRAAESFKRQLMEMDTEITSAVSDVEKEASAAFTVDPSDPSEPEAEGYDPDSPYADYGRDYYSDDQPDDLPDDPPAEVASAEPSPDGGAVSAVSAPESVDPAPKAVEKET